ncbi:SLC13 family permease [Saccharopolyspora mangrovi]|uniref:SLC13 family permease n=1 Tax=Saccharopolyspora mangrovi TaxID=3082379 RepID=A0ABU6AKG3_9PSEU|nr:SLC13 family permease [Saccharopolyspora sp. S2-29]MEB3372038.1 SLC13 family permease [Saccharopolyspora sp. S2-29]
MQVKGVEADPVAGWGWAVAFTLAGVGVFGVLAVLTVPAQALDGSLSRDALLTLVVFGAAIIGWTRDRIDDTFVALLAAAVLAVLGVLESERLFAALGEDQIWLLVAAFMLAAGINRTGLPARLAVGLAGRARTPRSLCHLLALGLVGTALLIPSTSGRAAMAVPLHRALASALPERLVRTVGLLVPVVILLSAIATLTGAGAHLITSQVLAATTGEGISFGWWLAWGLPFALVSSHLAAELVLRSGGADRNAPLRVDVADLRARLEVPDRMRPAEVRAGALLGVVVLLWSTESWHGLPPALVALGAALLVASPRFGTVPMKAAVGEIPWSLLLFMAATGALGTALTDSGAAGWIAGHALVGDSPVTLLVAVVVLSTALHLLVASRSARSAVLIPLLVPAALAVGANPVAVAFASTAAAGFCHTLPSSAKPLAVFAEHYDPRELRRLALVLGPVTAALVLLFSLLIWPLLGLSL